MTDHLEPQNLLLVLENRNEFQSTELAQELGVDHQKLVGAIKSLLTQDGLVDVKEVTIKRLELTSEGINILENGSHEYNVFKLVGEGGVPKSIIDVRIDKSYIKIVQQNQNILERAFWPDWLWKSHSMRMDWNRNKRWNNNGHPEDSFSRRHS